MYNLGKFNEEPGNYAKFSMPKGKIFEYLTDTAKQHKEIKAVKENLKDLLKENPGLSKFLEAREEALIQIQDIKDSYQNKRDNYDDLSVGMKM